MTTTHAVDSRKTSGAVPLWRRNTAPSEPGQTHLPEPTEPLYRPQGGTAVEDTVSPPRAPTSRERSSDVSITKVSVPLAMQAAVIGVALYIASQLWGLSSRLDTMTVLMEQQKKNEAEYRLLLNENIDLKIRNAGLQTSAMDLATALAEARAAKGK